MFLLGSLIETKQQEKGTLIIKGLLRNLVQDCRVQSFGIESSRRHLFRILRIPCLGHFVRVSGHVRPKPYTRISGFGAWWWLQLRAGDAVMSPSGSKGTEIGCSSDLCICLM